MLELAELNSFHFLGVEPFIVFFNHAVTFTCGISQVEMREKWEALNRRQEP